MIDLKRINVSVFLIYAGIIHAIGLALLLPIIVTMPGPGRAILPKATSVDVTLAPAEPDSEQTSALPAPQQESGKDGGTAAAPEAPVLAPGDVASVSPEAQPEATQQSAPAGKTKADKAKPGKKPVAQRGRTSKSAVHRPAKTQSKIAPFNGALSGLFAPGAAAKRR